MYLGQEDTLSNENDIDWLGAQIFKGHDEERENYFHTSPHQLG